MAERFFCTYDKIGVAAQIAAQLGQPAIKPTNLRPVCDAGLALSAHNACRLAEEYAEGVGKGGRQSGTFAQDGHVVALTCPEQGEDEGGGEGQESNFFRKIAAHILLVECHDRQFHLLCSQCLFQLLGQCHHTGIGTRVSGPVVAHEEDLQRLPFGMCLKTAKTHT